jgi:Ser/Thr protein kinase RdoA (MazF antagonist)
VWRDGERALKVFSREERPRAELEAAILRHLSADDARVRVQKFLELFEGEEGELVLATRWEPGTYKSYDRISGEEWRQLGTALAALHVRLDDFVWPLERLSERRRDLAAERAQIADHRARIDDAGIRAYLDQRILLLDERAARCAANFPAGEERAIHNDFNQYNYLFEPGRTPLILDWERAILAPREYEVVRTLNQLPLESPELARRFLDGYGAVRALDGVRLRWAVDALLTEQAVKHWPVERWLRGEADGAERLAGNVQMVQTLTAGRAALDGFYA